MSTIEDAIEIAARAHKGQVDKAGAPYIYHPLRVMLSVTTLHERMTAVLHDVVEDSSMTFDDLRASGIPPEVVDAVDAVTKRHGEERLDAARRAVENPIARVVKLADVSDNMNLSRLPDPSEKDYERLEKYKAVKALLEAGPAT